MSMLQALIGSFAGAAAPASFSGTISTNQTDLNLRTWALANGWNGTVPATITIGSGIIISGSVQGNSTAALTVDGSWPGGVTLVNSGVIVGRGGDGAAGSSGTIPAAGAIGGTALTVSVATSINNTGTIAGGGGGGGGGGVNTNTGGADDSRVRQKGCGGGGGASSNTNSLGGAGGTGGTAVGNPGTGGTYNTAGAGGTKVGHCSGGAGGTWGASGTAGVNGNITAFTTDNGSAGGAGGRAVNGNASITWIATGTRLGSIV